MKKNEKNYSKGQLVCIIIGHLLCGVAFLFGITALVMWLWNLLIPTIIGWSTIGFWQAMGILVLVNLLFFPHFRHRGHHRHHHSHCCCDEDTQLCEEEQE